MPDAPEIQKRKIRSTRGRADHRHPRDLFLVHSELWRQLQTSSILKTSEASDQWNYFQAKSTKAQLAAMHGDDHAAFQWVSVDQRRRAVQLKEGCAALRYREEEMRSRNRPKARPSGSSRAFSTRSTIGAIGAALLLNRPNRSICSVSIWVESHKFWWHRGCS